jgi:transcriptional regulator with XRE-family HTH domain
MCSVQRSKQKKIGIEINSILAKNLKELRALKGLSQSKFAKTLGVHRGHVARLETGTANPSNHLVKLICATFRIHEAWLREGIGPMEAQPGELLLKIENISSAWDEFRDIVYTKMLERFEILNMVLNDLIRISRTNDLFEEPPDKSVLVARIAKLRNAVREFQDKAVELEVLLSQFFEDDPKSSEK